MALHRNTQAYFIIQKQQLTKSYRAVINKKLKNSFHITGKEFFMLEKSHPTHRNQKREQSRNLSAAILWLISYGKQVGRDISLLQAVSQHYSLFFMASRMLSSLNIIFNSTRLLFAKSSFPFIITGSDCPLPCTESSLNISLWCWALPS